MRFFRRFRACDLAVVAALPFTVGLPWLWAQHLLFGPAEPVWHLLSRFALSPDALTAVVMAAYCLLFSLTLLVGHCLLRRFLIPEEAG